MDSWSFEKAIEVCREERLPAVLVDLDAFDHNVQQVKALFNGSKKTLRVATKSIRVPDLIKRILDAGPPYKGLMCYSAAEVRFLAGQGFDDFLLAYPTLQAGDLQDVRAVMESGKLVRLMVDSVESIQAAARAIPPGSPKKLGLVVDLDMSLMFGPIHIGVRRSPVRGIRGLGVLLDEIAKYPALEFHGLMGYEAQVAGLGDRNPFKKLMNPIFTLVRELSVRQVAKRRQEFAEYCRYRQVPLTLFNGGGTGSLTYALEEAALTELTAGSAFLCSHLFDYYSNFRTAPAFYFALPTTRSSDRGIVTCLGGGYIASGEPGWDKVPVPVWPQGAKLLGAEAAGEVQTPVQLSSQSARTFPLGDPVFFRHAKSGELSERFLEYILIQGGKKVAKAKTYRGLQQSFF